MYPVEATPALQARRLEDGVLIDLPLGSRSLYLLLRSHTPLRCHARAALPTKLLGRQPGGRTTLIPPYARRYIGGVERGAGGIIAPANRESCRAGCCCDRCICEKTTCCDCGISAGADVVLVIVGVKRGCGRSGMWPRLRSCSCARLIVPVCCALSIERSAALVGAAVFGRSWAC